MPSKDGRANPPKKLNLLGPKVRGRPGRDPKPTPAQQDDHAAALALGRSTLGLAVRRAREALDAVKPLYLKDEQGFAPTEDVPDHAIRLRASDFFADRFGLPKKLETDSTDPFAAMMLAVAAALKETDSNA